MSMEFGNPYARVRNYAPQTGTGNAHIAKTQLTPAHNDKAMPKGSAQIQSQSLHANRQTMGATKYKPALQYSAVVLIVVLVALAIAGYTGKSKMESMYAAQRQDISERLRNELNQSNILFAEQARQNGNARISTFYQIARHVYTADTLNDLLIENYGDEYSVMKSDDYMNINDIVSNCVTLQMNGQSLTDQLSNLEIYIQSFAEALNTRFTETGDVIARA